MILGDLKNSGMQNKIKEIRKSKGLSAAKLGDLVGTSQQQIDRLEKSQRRLDTVWIERLATALNVSPADIVPDLTQTETVEQKRATLVSAIDAVLEDIEEGSLGSLLLATKQALKEKK